MQRLLRMLMVASSSVLLFWRIVADVVDWLSRFEFVAHQVSRREWVADVIEAVLTYPPPFELAGTLLLLAILTAAIFMPRF